MKEEKSEYRTCCKQVQQRKSNNVERGNINIGTKRVKKGK